MHGTEGKMERLCQSISNHRRISKRTMPCRKKNVNLFLEKIHIPEEKKNAAIHHVARLHNIVSDCGNHLFLTTSVLADNLFL